MMNIRKHKWTIAMVLIVCLALLPAMAEGESPETIGTIEARVGEYITFGHYEQDNKQENGKEPIEWLVMDIQDGRAFVISRYGLEPISIHNTDEEATWETCDLRAWLNGEFMEIAFTDAECARIPVTAVEAHKDPNADKYYYPKDIDPGNDTQDQIFVLSAVEKEHYFLGAEAGCKATAYAIAKGAKVYDKNYSAVRLPNPRSEKEESDPGYCFWWLRSPGEVNGSFAYASYNGGYFWGDDLEHSNHFTTEFGCGVTVRPAMWVELEP